MQNSRFQKHLFYGTLLVLLFMGTLSSVFRDDWEGKVVSVVCAITLFAVAVGYYILKHRSLP